MPSSSQQYRPPAPAPPPPQYQPPAPAPQSHPTLNLPAIKYDNNIFEQATNTSAPILSAYRSPPRISPPPTVTTTTQPSRRVPSRRFGPSHFFAPNTYYVSSPAPASRTVRINQNSNRTTNANRSNESDDNDSYSEHPCVVCQVEKANVAVVPCGHVCLCQSCSNTYQNLRRGAKQCPICRGSMEKTMKIYLSS